MGTKKPVELINIDDTFLSGESGAFSEDTPSSQRKKISEKINGLNVTDEQKRFVDMYIFTEFDEVAAYNTVFNKNGRLDGREVKKEARKLIEKNVSVRNYLEFIRDQALHAMGMADEAEFYMKKIVESLYQSIEQDIFDYLDFNKETKMVSLRDPDTLTKEQRKRVKKLRVTQTENKDGKRKTIVDVELHDKIKQVELMMKHLKMFTKRGFGEHTSKDIEKLMKNAEEAVYEDMTPAELSDGS